MLWRVRVGLASERRRGVGVMLNGISTTPSCSLMQIVWRRLRMRRRRRRVSSLRRRRRRREVGMLDRRINAVRFRHKWTSVSEVWSSPFPAAPSGRTLVACLSPLRVKVGAAQQTPLDEVALRTVRFIAVTQVRHSAGATAGHALACLESLGRCDQWTSRRQ
jgi:hypothetical protein